mgnify:CR=1 FL=1
MTFWERIQNLCLEKGTTPTALCKSLGLSTSMVTRWKHGTIPNQSTMELLADALGVSAHFLMWGGELKLDLKQFSADPKEKEPGTTLDPRLLSLLDSMDAEQLAEIEQYAEFILNKKKS